jgi:hypothetical protein
MADIDREEFQKRLDRISELFGNMVTHADAQASTRCPYRNRFDQCTAKFHCRNQRPPAEAEGELMCGHDGAFDYRAAWETDPESFEKAKAKIDKIKREAAHRRAAPDDTAESHDSENQKP